MPTLDVPLRSATEVFAADIAALVRKAALDAVSTALEAARATIPSKPAAPEKKAAPTKAVPAKKAPSPPAAKAAPVAKKPAKPAPTPKATAKKGAPPKRPLGAKRPPAELAVLVEKLGAYIQAHPGQGAEAIGKALGTPTSELSLPIKKLIAAGRIRFKGVKRATKYFPA